MAGIIYIIRNLVDGKVYIGQTRRSLKDRWFEHCRKPVSSNEGRMSIKKAIRTLGKENFSIEILETCDAKDLNDREYYYIKLYNSNDPKVGYNGTCGGSSLGKPLKLNAEQQRACIQLYNEGKSLRKIATKFNVDHATVKNILKRSGITLHKTRTYKYTPEDREAIMADLKVLTRKEICKKWQMSKSYLSQLVNGSRRI